MTTESDAVVLDFIAARLVHVYGESPNTDFVLRLRRMADEAREREQMRMTVRYETDRDGNPVRIVP